MIEHRSASQILYGFLPDQTVDLRRGVWRVTHWRRPLRISSIDDTTLRRELRRLAAPWRATNRDSQFVSDLERGTPVEVYQLDNANGVEVEPFPRIWMCKSCRRIHNREDAVCACGSRQKGQLPFVGYHDECGVLREPYIPRCPQHDDVRIHLPGTTSAREIRFECPQCQRVLRRGFGPAKCSCGQGDMRFNVHRAASVYTPRSIVIVNPPSRDRVAALAQAGGPARALSWVVEGMTTRTVEEMQPRREALRRQLLAQGLPAVAVEQMLQAAEQSGAFGEEDAESEIPADIREVAETQAVTIALAASESRIKLQDLVAGSDPVSELGILYRDRYPVALESAGIESIDLLDQFPVLSGHFGYSRGAPEPGATRLRTFRETNGIYRVYADLAQTEALFVRLDPLKVARWLIARGHELGADTLRDRRRARHSILERAQLPNVTDDNPQGVGADVLRLVHSYAHRFIRICAVFSGIDRNALSELLVPIHLGFFVYAAAKGDFVLGGLQAVFEGELDRLLESIVGGEHRCALDPGCSSAGGACVACLHLGEPSCRYFNRFLGRETLTGNRGYFAA